MGVPGNPQAWEKLGLRVRVTGSRRRRDEQAATRTATRTLTGSRAQPAATSLSHGATAHFETLMKMLP
jgi:hypothetical protein